MPSPLAYFDQVMNTAQLLWCHPMARRDRMRTLLRIARWQVMSRLKKEIDFSWIANQKLVIQKGMTGATGNVYVGLHEFTDMMFLLHFLRECDLFFDIGANVGAHTVLASGVRAARTWAFEPDPDSMRALNRNIEINRLQNLVAVHNVAVGDSDQQIGFTVGLGASNRVVNIDVANCRAVQQRQIDSLIGDATPIFAKLNINRYEEKALRGGKRLLDRLKVISLETLTQWSFDTLAAHGFGRIFYDPFARVVSTEPVGHPMSHALFTRDFDLVKRRVERAPSIDVLGHSI